MTRGRPPGGRNRPRAAPNRGGLPERVLDLLAMDGQTWHPDDLADRLRANPLHMRRTLARMTAAGYVVKRQRHEHVVFAAHPDHRVA